MDARQLQGSRPLRVRGWTLGLSHICVPKGCCYTAMPHPQCCLQSTARRTAGRRQHPSPVRPLPLAPRAGAPPSAGSSPHLGPSCKGGRSLLRPLLRDVGGSVSQFPSASALSTTSFPASNHVAMFYIRRSVFCRADGTCDVLPGDGLTHFAPRLSSPVVCSQRDSRH